MIGERQRTISADEFHALSQHPGSEGKTFDLIEGVVYEVVTGGEHGEITSHFEWHIRNHVLKHRLGRVTSAETGYLLYKNPEPAGKDTVLGPDIGFVTLARAPKPFGEGYVPFAPDLAVEVVSPGNSSEDIELKVETYLKYGTRLVWLVYPKQVKVRVCRPNSGEPGGFSGGYLNADDLLTGGDVLPGFQILVADIFKDPLEG